MDIRSTQPTTTRAARPSNAAEVNNVAAKLGEHIEGEVLVKLKPGISGAAEESLIDSYGAEVVETFDLPGQVFKSFQGELVRVKLPEGTSTAQAIADMSKDGRIEYAAPNSVYHLDDGQDSQPPAQGEGPNDLQSALWGLHNTGQNGGKADADIDAPEAWRVTTGKRVAEGGPLIAVIDTGADYNHPDLKNNIWTNPGEIPGDGIDNDGNGVIDDVHGYNANADNGDPMDGHSHGSHCSGTIAGEGNNGEGVVGVNWQATIMPVKIFSDSGSTSADAILRGISYASRMGARITSNSWGGGAYNQAIADAFAASPALHIMAAGNSGSNNDTSPHYPSSYRLENSLAVAATDRNDQLASFSCYGANSVDLAAPGVDILSTVPGGKYGSKSGTSMATPHVTGVAGLIAAAYPEATNAEIKARLMAGADRLPNLADKVVSGGRLNAANALDNDALPPAGPDDFQVATAASNGLTLAWTATGDDGYCGQASSYELRFSDKPIVDGPAEEGQVSFEQATLVPTAAPQASGGAETAQIHVSPSGRERTLYVAMKVRDNVGNASAMSSLQATVPAAQVAFEDNMDGEANWTGTGAWGRVDSEGRGQVWTDSPVGNYPNNSESTLTSKPISLAGFSNATLVYDSKVDTEKGYDKVYVEASSDGQQWSQLANLTGQSDWSNRTADLSAFDGGDVQLRFRLKADNSINADGFYLDNLAITGDRQPQQPPQQPTPCPPEQPSPCPPQQPPSQQS